MNFLFVARNIPFPGFAENDIIVQLAQQLVLDGHRVEFVFPAEWLPIPKFFLKGKKSSIAKLGTHFMLGQFKVHVVKYLRLPSFLGAYRLAPYFFKNQEVFHFDYQVVHAHYALPDGAIAQYYAQLRGKPFYVTVRQGDINKMQDGSYSHDLSHFKQILAQAKLVFTPSYSALHYLESLHIKAFALPHGVPNISNGVIPDKSEELIRVLVVANAISRKNVPWVIEALAQYTGKQKVELVHIGDGPDLQAWKDYAEKLRVTVSFKGKLERSEVFMWMEKSHVFALPSDKETFGLVYLEAALMGCAVLARENTGIFGYFEANEEMLFSGSKELFIKQLHSILNNELSRKEIALKGYKRVQKDYLWDSVVDRYLTHIGDI